MSPPASTSSSCATGSKHDWNKQPPAPALPADVLAKTAESTRGAAPADGQSVSAVPPEAAEAAIPAAAAPTAPPPPPQPTNVVDADEAAIARAVELLRAGELVAFPTETVYGLGADASTRDAVTKIFARRAGRRRIH